MTECQLSRQYTRRTREFLLTKMRSFVSKRTCRSHRWSRHRPWFDFRNRFFGGWHLWSLWILLSGYKVRDEKNCFQGCLREMLLHGNLHRVFLSRDEKEQIRLSDIHDLDRSGSKSASFDSNPDFVYENHREDNKDAMSTSWKYVFVVW